MSSKIETRYRLHDCERLFQGDILQDFVYPERVEVIKTKIRVKKRYLPYFVVLTQDCDLEQDYKSRTFPRKTQDAYLQSILVCPAYQAQKLRNGNHLEDLDLKMQYQNSDKWSDIKDDKNPRYQYLPEVQNENYHVPELTIDFKHYYCIPHDLIYEDFQKHYLASINELFRESLSQRFAQYISRIGLPEIENGTCSTPCHD